VIATSAAVDKFVSLGAEFTGIVVGGAANGWATYEDAYNEPADYRPDGITRATDPFLLYFTSGTTALPKLVLQTHQSYPVGHLATMYWIGIRPDDVHLNISSPGWAKHAWSSFFAPWNAGATIFVHNYNRFDANRTLNEVARCGVTTLCAPPTVWRMFVLEDLRSYPVKIRDLASAGEPLNPEIIEKVRAAWGITIRDGFGQTENVCLLGNFPGQEVKPGAVGKPSPGHTIALLDADQRPCDDGEISVGLNPRPISLFAEYVDDPERTRQVMEGGFYRTGDVAHRDADGYYTYVGRSDDVFKSSDYRLSPFELESALLEHDAIAEAAVVPSPDEIRWNVPKAFIVLKPGVMASRDLARDIFVFIRGRLGPYKRIRRLEFSELPKTISGKIRRVQLRAVEKEQRPRGDRRETEFWEEDFSDLK
jgi:acetyl-CoA synthetase